MRMIKRAYRVHRRVVNAATAEHEGIHAHTHVRPLGLDTLPHKHARAFLAVRTGHFTGFRSNFVTCAKWKTDRLFQAFSSFDDRRFRILKPWTIRRYIKKRKPTKDEYLIYFLRTFSVKRN